MWTQTADNGWKSVEDILFWHPQLGFETTTLSVFCQLRHLNILYVRVSKGKGSDILSHSTLFDTLTRTGAYKLLLYSNLIRYDILQVLACTSVLIVLLLVINIRFLYSESYADGEQVLIDWSRRKNGIVYKFRQ